MSNRLQAYARRTATAPFRRGILALGLVLLAVAQVYFNARAPLGTPNANAAIWNAVHNLELVNYDNVWKALPLLFGGALLWLLFGDGSLREAAEQRPSTLLPRLARADFAQLAIIAVLYAALIFRLTQLNKTSLEPVLWIFTLAWLTLLLWNWERHQTDLSPDIRAADLTSILVLLLGGIAIGAFALTDIPKQIIRDELPFWNASRAIAAGEYNASVFEVGVFTFPLSSSIYQSWFLKIFGASLWAWKFSSVIAGAAAVIPLYLLVRSWFDRRIAFAAGALMLVNPYFISFSRFGYNNIHSLFPATLAIYLWEKGLRKGSVFYLWLGGLAAGLGYYSYFSAWLAAVVAGLSVFYLRFLKQISWKRMAIYLALLVSAFALVAAPRVVFAVASGKHEALTLKIFQASFINTLYGRSLYMDADLARVYPLVEVAGMNEPVFFNPQVYWELFVRGFIRTFVALFAPYLSGEHFLSAGLAGVVAPIFFIIGLVWALKRWRDHRAGLLLLWFFGGMFFLGVLAAFPPKYTHLVTVIPALALFSGLGLSAAVDALTPTTAPRGFILASILAVISILSLRSFFVELPATYPADFETQSAWVARRSAFQGMILYAGPTDIDHLVGDLVNLGVLDARYGAAPESAAALVARKFNASPAVIFYEGNSSAVTRQIRAMGYHNFAAYAGGYAFANTDIDLEPKSDLRVEWTLFLQSPALVTLGIVLGGLCLHLLNERYCIVKLFVSKT